MLFSKLAVPLLGAIAVVPSSMAAVVTYEAALQEASKQTGKTPAQMDSELTANGGKPKLIAGIKPKLGWGKGVICDTTCKVCADCATGAGQAAIEILAAWAAATAACLTILNCPAAIAAASIATAASGASFCNSEHQPISCNFDCNWHVAECKTTIVPGETHAPK
jgi:hypothetical protein